MALPRLRQELDLLPGPVLSDGQPTWTLHDPVRHQFYQIDWLSFEILRRWEMGDSGLIATDIGARTTLNTTPEDVQTLLKFLSDKQLLQPAMGSAQRMAEQLAKIEGSAVQWILHHYLFFRIPLARPDIWLERWLPMARWLMGPKFAMLTVGALLLGLVEVAKQWDTFTASLADTFNWEGVLAYGMAIVVVKLLHELGHAFTAKHYGCHVPTMGVAFLVMWPVAYTDTNESWRLTSHRQRLQIALAGILTELVLAAWATLAWSILPEGELRNAMFVLATTSWVSTLIVNASPFMRFDGYFILSDALELPNLHERSFALARWQLREFLFQLREPPPEHIEPRKRTALQLFAYATWLYRLVLFVGIAILVYQFAFKLLGILLFTIEITWFVLWPLRSEWRVWRSHWPTIRARRRSRYTFLGVVVVLLLAVTPWPGRVTVTAILRPAQTWPIYAPKDAMVEALPYQNGALVPAGATMVQLRANELMQRRQALLARIEQRQWDVATAGFDSETRNRMLSSQEALTTAHAELSNLEEELARYAVPAPFSGHILDMDPDLQVGQWLQHNEKIGLLVGKDSPWLVETWLDDETIARIETGDAALFIAPDLLPQALHLQVNSIDRNATPHLPRAELAVQTGGHVLTREKNGRLYPERAIYHVLLNVPADKTLALPTQSIRGHLTLHARWEAPLWRYLKQTLVILVREAGF